MINNLIESNQLQPADVVVAKKRKGLGRILNHYLVYAGNGVFTGNLRGSVKKLTHFELNQLLNDYEPIRIKRFQGDHVQRQWAINRAFARLGEKYNLTFFNCEHYANWVQKGKETSAQVLIAFTILLFGLTYKLIKSSNGKR